MNQRNRLIELIINSVDGCARNWAETIADYLLDNGVIVPPCKVGDVIYTPVTKYGSPWVNEEPVATVSAITVKTLVGTLRAIDVSEIGETVFLTRGEAEKALEEKK